MSLGKKLFIGSSAAGACSTDSVNPFDDGFTSSKALYQFDGDANDTTGSYNATASSGVTYTSGYIGQAATMNGSHSINTNDGGALLGETWSISLFVKFNNANDYEYIAANWRSSPTPRITNWYLLKRNSSNSNVLEFNVYGSNGTNANYKQFIAPVSSAFTSNTWYHIAISFNGSSATNVGMYINGLPVSYTTATGSGWDGSAQVSTTLDTTLGALSNSSSGGNYLDGQIDQVRFFNKAISDAEAAILGNEATATASDINVLNDGSGVALYSLDYDASDAGGNYDGTATDVTFGVDGQINWGASFNGTSSVIDTNNVFSNNVSKITYSTWVYFDNLNTQNFIMFPDSGATGNGFGFFDYGNGNIYFQSDNATNSNRGYISNSGLYSTNEWVHFALVFDGTATGDSNRLKAYVNGNLLSLTFSGTIPSTTQSSSYNLLLGSRKNSSLALSGKMDQVRIFNKALSFSEVSTLYGETACVYTSTTDNNDYPVTNKAYYKLDNNAEDAKGNYDGTATNVNYEFGRFGQAAVFNGSSSYITANKSMFGTGDGVANLWSISLWFKTDGSVTASRTLVGTKGGSTQSGFFLYMITGGQIRYYEGNTSTNSQQLTTTTSYDDGNWHNVVITRSGTTDVFTMYIDGAEVIAPTTMTNPHTSHNFNLHIGRYPASATFFWDGSIDQVRIFDSALDAAAVENLYNEKSEINTSNFETVLYQGNSGSQYVSNVGFKPDLVWMKCRNVSKDHRLYDSIRGTTHFLEPNNTDSEGTASTSLTSFNANGFTLGAASTSNSNNDNFVAWCWKAGGDAVDNTNGNPTSQVSANQDAGFSVVKYTGNGSAMTIGHGLSSAPELIIFKSTNTTQDWLIATTVIDGSLDYFWDATAGFGVPTKSDLPWSVPDSSVINFGSSSTVINNLSGTQQMIAYCFHSVTGYQKIGSYTGKGNSATNTISFGFAPKFVMIKRTDSAGGWRMFDNVRSAGSYPVRINHSLRANLNNDEYDASPDPNGYCSFTNDGLLFSTSETNGDINANGGTYVYLAIA